MLREQEKLNARLVRDGRVEDWNQVYFLAFDRLVLAVPSRELTYPTWGIGKSSSKVPLKGDNYVSFGKHVELNSLQNPPPWDLQPSSLQDHIDFVQSRKVCAIVQVQRLSTLQSAVFLSLRPIMFVINFYPPWKLTCPRKINGWKTYFLLT